ncbi:MAG: peptide deformylase [Gemmatimonadota bacterium]|jgi:peptide deformylase
MAVREIRIFGDPVLRDKAETVGAVDDEVRELVRDMFDTMYASDGVGLAAPQVGVLHRVIVVDPRDPEVEPVALVNPEVVTASDETEKGEEGCLSIPGLRDVVERPATAVIRGLDVDGNEVVIEADQLLARALLHEIDHLDGVLFLDRVSPLKRKMLLKKWQKLRAEEPAARGA